MCQDASKVMQTKTSDVTSSLLLLFAPAAIVEEVSKASAVLDLTTNPDDFYKGILLLPFLSHHSDLASSVSLTCDTNIPWVRPKSQPKNSRVICKPKEGSSPAALCREASEVTEATGQQWSTLTLLPRYS